MGTASPGCYCGIGRKKNDTGKEEREISAVRMRLRKVRRVRAQSINCIQ